MKKFECKDCEADCELIIQMDEFMPRYCLYDTEKADWHEVKEDSAKTEQFGNSEQLPSNPRNLPDWVNVGEWVYCPTTGNYGEVVDQQGNTVLLRPFGSDDDTVFSKDINIILERGKPAKKRLFNANEMKALVGKVLEWENNLELVISYNEADVDVYVYQMWCSAKYLMDNEYTIDGKPCFKLEHLNENGEWVE